MKNLFLVALLLVFSCNKSEAPEVSSPPNWFLEAKSNNIEIYATGSGGSKEDAIQMALLNAISQIKTSVSASVRTEAQMINGRIEEQMQVKALNEVERFSFNGYEITNTAFNKKNNLFYAEIKLNKLKIYNQKLTEYEAKKEEIEEIIENAKKSKNPSISIKNAKEAKSKAQDLRKDTIILNALSSTFNLREELKKISNYENHYQELISKMSFSVAHFPSENFKLITEKVLREKNLKVDRKAEIKASIHLDFTTSTNKVYDVFFAQTNTNFTIIFTHEATQEGNRLDKSFTFKGSSRRSEEEAHKASLTDFETQLKQVIEEIL
jgi:hypothetical protein